MVAHGDDPVRHYLSHGWKERRKPNIAFDPAWYTEQSGDTEPSQVEPLWHYCTLGEAEGRKPVPWFDPAWYRFTYKVPSHTLSLLHYLRHRLEAEVYPDAIYRLSLDKLRMLFDADWYAGRYPDVLAHGADPFEHYSLVGWREGRWPNAAFDPGWYIFEAGLTPGADGNPLSHYAQVGERAGLRPISWFDPGWYRAAQAVLPQTLALAHYIRVRKTSLIGPNALFDPVYYASLISEQPGSGQDMHQHFLSYGRRDGHLPRAESELLQLSGLVDEEYYRFNNPDAEPDAFGPARHYLHDGEMRGRRPNPYFDPTWYASRNGRCQPGMSCLTHYILAGEAERPSLYFDPEWYRRVHGLPNYASPLAHYLRHRRKQTVSPLPFFDVAFYMSRYGESVRANRDPFIHYLTVGARQGFNPASWFDGANYKRVHMHDKAIKKLPPDIGSNPLLHMVSVFLNVLT